MKFLNSLLIIFLAILSIVSCKNKQDQIVQDYKTFLKDSIIINTGKDDIKKFGSFFKIFISQNIDYITILDRKQNLITFLSIQKEYKNFEIKLPIIQNKILDYKIINKDSIFLLTDSNSIFLCNKEKIIQKYLLTCKTPYGIRFNLFSPLEVYKKKNFVFNYPLFGPLYYKTNLLKYYKSKIDLNLKIINDKLIIDNVTGSFPPELLKNTFNIFTYSRTLNFNANKIIYSFRHSKNIEVVDLETKKSKIIKLEAGIFAENDTLPFSKIADINFKKKYTVENDRFNGLIYDKYNNKYIRVLTKGIKYENDDEDGTVNSVLDKPLYFLIYDENFKLEKVIKFAEKKYCYWSILVTSKGILVSKDHPNNKEKNKMKYDLFKFY